jgi:hypothetical protein
VSGLLAVGTGDEEKLAHDEASVEALVTALGAPKEKVIRFRRIKTRNDKSNLVVEFDSDSTRDSALKGSGNLKSDNRYVNVYVYIVTLPPVERMAEKIQRDERNKQIAVLEKDDQGRPRGLHDNKRFYWGIRSGELKRIYDKSN